MTDIILTALIPLAMLAVFLGGGKLLDTQRFTFLKDYTGTLKGLAAIVVILVHIHGENGNMLQDAIGSFAYVGVTFFFLVSAYGMQMGAERKNGYMRTFWRNRLASLLVPMLLVNIVAVATHSLWNGEVNWLGLTHLNGYVKVLLTYCIWFWIVETAGRKLGLVRRTIDCILIAGVAVSSLALYVFTYSEVSAESGWCFERMGLVWGFLLYRYFGAFAEWMNRNRRRKMAVSLLLGLIFGVAYLKFKTVWFTGEYLLKIILGLTLLVTLFLWTGRMQVGNRVSRFLGDISYEIYLLHGFVMGVINHYLVLPSGLFILTTVLATIVLSYVLHTLGKPLVRMIRALE